LRSGSGPDLGFSASNHWSSGRGPDKLTFSSAGPSPAANFAELQTAATKSKGSSGFALHLTKTCVAVSVTEFFDCFSFLPWSMSWAVWALATEEVAPMTIPPWSISKELLNQKFCTVILFCVSVPVLSEQMQDAEPSVSMTSKFLTRT